MRKTLKPRAIKRLTDREKALIHLKYQRLCQDFYKAIFGETSDEKQTYDSILKKYCHLWKAICEQLSAKLQLLTPNPDCFYNEFKSAI
jgi:arabinogalactan endo-1,4-beta-galactosidase